MPAIHIMYDPRDRISGLPPEVLKELGVSVAIMRVQEGLDRDEVRHLAGQLTIMLLEQINGS